MTEFSLRFDVPNHPGFSHQRQNLGTIDLSIALRPPNQMKKQDASPFGEWFGPIQRPTESLH